MKRARKFRRFFDFETFYMGNYYNFYAATAGSGHSKFTGEAPDSICPKGWRMVGNEGKVDEKEEKSWVNLFSKYYSGYEITWPGIEDGNTDTITLLSNFSFLRSGDYGWDTGGINYYRAWNGFYWSIKAYSGPRARFLDFRPSWLAYQSGDGKGYGLSLRCVAR